MVSPQLPNNPFYDHLEISPHRPAHMVGLEGAYMVTGATQGKQHFFRSRKHLRVVSNALLSLANRHGWKLDAWSVLANHYHFIGRFDSSTSSQLPEFIQDFHAWSAKLMNTLDGTPGRRVWYQYWDSYISYQKSYMARLKYVMQNPVKHGLVDDAKQYPWCSASHFESVASSQFAASVSRFNVESLKIYDDF